jgi:autotransporter-associated beta strand protein
LGLRQIEELRPVYLLPGDDLLGKVIVPALRASDSHDVMAGFFHSGVLKQMAGGFAEFVSKPDSTLRLIASPVIAKSDQQAMRRGSEWTPEDLGSEMEQILGSREVTESALATYTLTCLAYLISAGRIRIKLVLVRDGLFHPKVQIFRDGADTLILAGSNNYTGAAVLVNVEQVQLSRSWVEGEAPVVDAYESTFAAYWSGRADENVRVVDLPDAVRLRLLRDYAPASPPSRADFERALTLDRRRTMVVSGGWYGTMDEAAADGATFAVPVGLTYRTGPYAHQGRAVDAWEAAGGRGILSMATGSGKTKTSLVCAQRLYTRNEALLVVVAAPLRPLVDQWAEEVRGFGLVPVVPGEAVSRSGKLAEVASALRRLRQRRSSVECLVVTHNLLCDPEFHAAISGSSVPKLLIADEAHNLGRPAFVDHPPEFFDYRLGLSATPERQYDPEGTASLKGFFGDVVFEFTLAEAIGVCLVPYDYFVHPVHLSVEETEHWATLTERLKRMGWRPDSDESAVNEAAQKLLIARRRILEQAESKIGKLSDLLQAAGPRRIKHTLFYASDKGGGQLESVNAVLGELGVWFHQVTHEESGDRRLLASVLDRFAAGGLQALTAMRVLDEGVDIPETTTGYIVASTSVERQWVQRRGRLLRLCPRIGKEKAFIHDFLVLPPDDARAAEDGASRMVSQELRRIRAFAETAANAGSRSGPLDVTYPIAMRYL